MTNENKEKILEIRPQYILRILHRINLTLIINKKRTDKGVNGTNSKETKKKRQTEKQTLNYKEQEGRRVGGGD